MENSFFATDCEGPISKNDNAMELAAHFLPQGEPFFARISKYDDYLADVERRPGYRAGDTLKLILPFFKAFGVTEKDMEDFSRSHILLLPQAAETLTFISSLMPCYIVSTSYRPYIRALCQAVGLSEDHAFSTSVPLDAYPLPVLERRRLEALAREIADLPEFDWPESARRLEDLSPTSQESIRRLDEIFWTEIAGMEVGRLIFEIRPVGGEEKAQALLKISLAEQAPLNRFFYVGDSITDVQAFQRVNQARGLTLSFNGNAYAVRESSLACLSPNTLPMAAMARAFNQSGPAGVFKLAGNWSREALLSLGLRPSWVDLLFPEGASPLSEVFILNPENRSRIAARSSQFRKQVRGEAIGSLG